MRILLVLNKPNREIPIMKSIRNEILKLAPDVIVDILQRFSPGFTRYILKNKPDVILTYPFTSIGLSTWFYLYKLIAKSKIVSYRAEGVVDFNVEYNVQWATGFDRYGPNLVDYELFWGPIMSKYIGGNLLKQGKLSSDERIKTTGYPRLEHYTRIEGSPSPQKIPQRILSTVSKYKKEQIILLITGFHFANYTREDIFRAKDLDAENRCDELLEGVEISKKFRQAWIDNIILMSREHPDLLFIVKKHPIEKREDYEVLNNNNILYIHEDIELQDLIPMMGVLFHYGSTTLVDSYMSKIPSVYIYSDENKYWYTDIGWPSTARAPVSEMSGVVKKYIDGKIEFRMTPEINEVLKEYFNIDGNKPYNPSKDIAEIILDEEPPQKINLSDIYLWKSLFMISYFSLRKLIGRMIRRVMGIPHDEPLLCRKK